MRTRGGVAALTAVVLLGVAPAGAPAKKIVTHSPDSLAPPNAPAHWLPPEPWVYNHWLPYDEGRLYRVLGITRQELWLQLRDDRHTVAQLAARHGHRDVAALAARLVAPRARRVGRAMARTLRQRAERTLTQGHLAQHVFFHSLHQFAIPSAAPDIFGVTDAEFRVLRRTELSPLAIGRLHGRFTGEIQAQAIAVLRDRIRAGIAGGDMTAAQGRLLLRRQLTQLPRWLDQQRYNGPPTTHDGALTGLPHDYASNPMISGDGRYVAYESYRQKLALAITLGEIAVMRHDLSAGRSDLLSPVLPADAHGAQPQSAYNPSISGDGGRVVYETSAGNQNFAKRYGPIGVLLCDLHGGSATTAKVDERASGPPLADSLSAYNPVVSADGATVAYEAIRKGRTSILLRRGEVTRAIASGTAAGGASFSDVYEPGLSADGSRVVMTRTRGRLSSPRAARTSVVVRDVAAGRTIAVSPSGVQAGDGAISPDGRYVAFTARTGDRLGLFLRDLQTGMLSFIPAGFGRPLDPVVARGGTAVAFTMQTADGSQVRVWRAAGGAVEIASRATGAAGAVAAGRAEDPSISDDGTRVAFTASDTSLASVPSPDPRSIYVRDLAAQTTTLVSQTARAYPEAGR